MNPTESQIDAIVAEVLRRLRVDTSGVASGGMTGEVQLTAKVIGLADVAVFAGKAVTLRVATGAIVTPAARDWLREKEILLIKEPAKLNNKNEPTANQRRIAVPKPSTIVWADVRPTTASAAVLRKLRDSGSTVQQIARTGQSTMVAEVAEQVAGHGFRGVVLTGEPWSAVIGANRRQSVQAVWCRDQREIHDAQRTVEVNCLIIDHARQTQFGLWNILRPFVER
ncbi:MAG: hypothetical protein SFX18_18965 [Pirellulales bacterium]|nr:hypothetical protein [Pirellulales bacterium]